MKRILLSLCFLSSVFAASAQFQRVNGRGFEWKGGKFDSTLHIPKFAGTPTLRGSIYENSPAIGFDTTNHLLYLYDPSTKSWSPISSNAVLQDGRISGAEVTWTGDSTAFFVPAGTFRKFGEFYTTNDTTIILDRPNDLYGRIDLIVFDTTNGGEIRKVTGELSPTPVEPQVEDYQIKLTTGIAFSAGATTPSNVSVSLIYDENTEWTAGHTGTMTVDFNNTSTVYHGSKSALISSYSKNSALTFGGTSIDVTTDGVLSLWINLSGSFSKSFTFQLWNNTTVASNSITVSNTYGFDPNYIGWQNIAIPLSAFSWTSQTFNKATITITGNGSFSGLPPFYLDYMQVQKGLTNSTTPADYSGKLDAITVTKTTDSKDTIHTLNEVAKGISTKVAEIRTPQPITLKAVGVVNIDSLSNREYQIRVNTSNDSTFANANDSTLPTTDAVKKYVDNHAGGGSDANAVHKTGNESIADIKNFTGKIGVNNTNPLAPIHVGNSNINNSTNAQILVSGNVDNTITGNGHAFADGSQITRGGNMAYASYDARVNILGTNSYDHYVSFQASPSYSSSGTITNLYGLYSLPTITAGIVTNRYGAFITDANVTGGSITNDYGLYINSPTAGTSKNYPIYVAGSGRSFFNGGILSNDTIQANTLRASGNTNVAGILQAGSIYAGTSGYTPVKNIEVRSGGEATLRLGQIGQNNWDLKSVAGTTRFDISDVGGTYLTILNGGKVGIGTISPAEKLEVVGNIKATSFIKSGGTSSQFLKADGSVDGNSYATTIVVDKATFKTLKSTSALLPGRWYNITNATSLLLPIYVQAMTSSSYDSTHIILPGYSYTTAYFSIASDWIRLTDRISGVARCTDGVWAFISNQTHDKENLDSIKVIPIGQPNSGRLAIYYTKQNYYTNVGNVVAVIDNNYPWYGITAGTSVGTNLTYIDMFKSTNVQDSITWDGSVFRKVLNSEIDTATFDNTDNTVLVKQKLGIESPDSTWGDASFPLTNTYPTVSPIADGYFPRVVYSDNISAKIAFYDFTGNKVTTMDSKCKFIYQRTGLNRVISDYNTLADGANTNIWIQGWMFKVIP